jgi:D-psicose/D-tagatose/L-ribulose 3-epimerase
MNNRIGLHYTGFLKDWQNEPAEYIVRAARLGFDSIAINAVDFAQLSDAEAADLKKLAEDCRIDLTYSLNLGPDRNISSSDEQIRQQGQDFVISLLKKISAVDGRLVSGITYGAVPDYPENAFRNRPRAVENSVRSLQSILKVAEDCGITYCIEPLVRFENFMLNTAAQAVEICDAVSSPNIGILLDTFHMNMEERNITQAIKQAGRYLKQMHLAENYRGPLGSGGLFDWDELFAALKRIDFSGELVLEHFCIPGGDIGQDVRVTRDLIEDTTDEGVDQALIKSIAFLKQKLRQ